jgi:hypothetical protein
MFQYVSICLRDVVQVEQEICLLLEIREYGVVRTASVQGTM